MANKIQMQIELDGKNALRTITALQKGLDKAGKQGKKSIGGINTSLSVLKGNLATVGILKGLQVLNQQFRQATGEALDFSKSLAEINSIAPRTSKETAVLSRQLLNFSSQFANKPTQEARAFYNIVSAGITDTSKALNVLEIANKAAVAGLVDVDTSAKSLISVINSYTNTALDAATASDILFTAVKEGRTTFGELEDIGRVASIAATAKLEFSELAGAIAFVTKSGLRTDETIIGLRGLLTSIIKPTADVAAAAKRMGIEFNAGAIAGGNFAKFFEDLKEGTKGNVTAIRELFPNVRAFNVAVKIAGGDLDDFNRILNETANSTGATDRALTEITNSAGFQFDKLKQQLGNLPVAFLTNFEEPVASALKAINGFVGSQGLLLIPAAVSIVVEAFQDMLNLKDDIKDFFASATEGVVNLFSAATTTGDLQDKLERLNGSLAGINKTLDRGIDSSSFTKSLEARRTAIEENIRLTKDQLDIFSQGDLVEAAIVAKDLKRRTDRNAKILAFQKQVEDAEVAFRERQKQRSEASTETDRIVAQKELDGLIEKEEKKRSIVEELAEAERQLNEEKLEAEAIAIQLEEEESFIRLADRLGREEAAREIARINQISNEQKRIDALKKLDKKADLERQKRIQAQAKFDVLAARQSISLATNTGDLINAISGKQTKAGFLLAKAGAAATVLVNDGIARAAATAAAASAASVAGPAAPAVFSLTLAQIQGVITANTAISLGTIAASTIKGFQGGGIVGGNSTSGDSQLIRTNSREAVFNLRQQKNLFNAVNSGNLGGGNGGITINLQTLDGTLSAESADNLIDVINDRTEFGNKRLGA